MGDPLYQEQEDTEQTGKEVDRINYDYLCCDDESIRKEHTIGSFAEYPVCDSDDLNYFRLNNMYYESYDAAALLEKMKESYEKKKILLPVNFQIQMYMHRREKISSIIFSHRHPRSWHNIMASARYGTVIQNMRSIIE